MFLTLNKLFAIYLAGCLLWQTVVGGALASGQNLVPSSPDAEPFYAQLPGPAVGIDVVDQVGRYLPLDLRFQDDRGQTVQLGDYFKKEDSKPVVLTLNYSDCPGLCIAQLQQLVGTLRAMDAKGLGDDYQVITVSIDPRESSDRASQTKKKYVGMLADAKAESAWHFLVGQQREIKSLAESVGYYYNYDRNSDRFNHPGVTYFISADGRICRYFLDLGIEPKQFQLAVAEAAEGKLTRGLADRFIQFCYYYDPETNRYSASARNLLTLGFGAFAVLMMGFLAPFWFGSKKKAGDASCVTAEETQED